MDLSEERDFVVDIGWAQPEAYRLVGNTFSQGFSTGTSLIGGATDNGIINVYVINSLTVPNTTVSNNIAINVFIAGCDDTEFIFPHSESLETLSYFPFVTDPNLLPLSRGPAHQSAGDDDLGNAPVQETTHSEVTHSLPDRDNTQSVYFGDPVTSFRQLLKRYEYFDSMVDASGAVVNDVSRMVWTVPVFPYHRGFDPDGPDTAYTPTTVPYSYVKMTLMNYLTPAYVCWRGSIRWKVDAMRSGQPIGSIGSNLAPDKVSIGYDNTVVPRPTAASTSTRRSLMVDNVDSGLQGFQTESMYTKGVNESELPYLWNQRFSAAKTANYTNPDPIDFDGLAFRDVNVVTVPSDIGMCLQNFVAAGEDFTLAFFTSVPTLYDYADPAPTP